VDVEDSRYTLLTKYCWNDHMKKKKMGDAR